MVSIIWMSRQSHARICSDLLEVSVDRIVRQAVSGSGFVQAIAPILNRTRSSINRFNRRAKGQVLEEGFTGSAEVVGFASWHT